VFDLSLPKLLILAVIALVVFGPHELPALAARAGRALRQLRGIAEGAKADLREGLGPEFSSFDFDDLNPRRFVQKHLLSDPGEAVTTGASVADASSVAGAAPAGPGDQAPVAAAVADAPFQLSGDAPFDTDAT
jgi:sec-independent protein translocase protein TatB